MNNIEEIGIFISYKREERQYAQELRDRLVLLGYRVWWDAEIQTGSKWHDTLDKALSDSSCVVVLWSHRSVQSPWVQYEASVALAQNRLAQAVIESDIQLPPQFLHEQHATLVGWDGTAGNEGLTSLLDRFRSLNVHPIREAERIHLWEKKWPSHVPGRWLRRILSLRLLMASFFLGVAIGIGVDRIFAGVEPSEVTNNTIGVNGKANSLKTEKDLKEEIQFRLDQMDKAINKARVAGSALLQDLEKGPVRGERIRNFFSNVGEIGATIELGGLKDIPATEERTFSFGYSGYHVRNLPEQRSYFRNEFKESTLLNLLEKTSVSPQKLGRVGIALNALEVPLDSIPQATAKRIHSAQLHVKESVSGYKSEIKEALDWVQIVNEKWTDVRLEIDKH